MCNPAAASAAQSAMAIASDVLSFKAQGKLYQRNARAAYNAYGDDLEALNARQDQVNRSASEDILSNQIAAIQERGRNIASANGLADISLGEVLQGVNAQNDRAKANIIYNRDAAANQTRRDMKAAQSTAKSRINSVARPSLTALAFRTVGNIAQGMTTYDELKDRGR